MNKNKIVFSTDWMAIYKDGELVTQDYEGDISISDIIKHVDLPVDIVCADNEWVEKRMADGSYMPDDFEDVVLHEEVK